MLVHRGWATWGLGRLIRRVELPEQQRSDQLITLALALDILAQINYSRPHSSSLAIGSLSAALALRPRLVFNVRRGNQLRLGARLLLHASSLFPGLQLLCLPAIALFQTKA